VNSPFSTASFGHPQAYALQRLVRGLRSIFWRVARSDGSILGALGLNERFGEAGLAQCEGLVGFALLGRLRFARVLLGPVCHSSFAPDHHDPLWPGLKRVFRLISGDGSLSMFICHFYLRDKDGKVVKDRDHFMDAMRYLIMSGRNSMATKPQAIPDDYQPQYYCPGDRQHTWMN
jgi:hypothetical protein